MNILISPNFGWKLRPATCIFGVIILMLQACSVTPATGTPAPVMPDQALPSALQEDDTCPVTPIQTDFWEKVGPVAGQFPVWISSKGQMYYSKLGPKVLPSTAGALQFIEGRTTKALVFVDKRVEGDLVITGRQLDGKGKIYFPGEASLVTPVNTTTLQLVKVPPDTKVIPSAHISTHFPEPPGKAHHGMGPLYLAPGCYQFTATIAEHTVEIVIDIIDDTGVHDQSLLDMTADQQDKTDGG